MVFLPSRSCSLSFFCSGTATRVEQCDAPLPSPSWLRGGRRHAVVRSKGGSRRATARTPKYPHQGCQPERHARSRILGSDPCASEGAERTALCLIVLGVPLREPPLAPGTWEAPGDDGPLGAFPFGTKAHHRPKLTVLPRVAYLRDAQRPRGVKLSGAFLRRGTPTKKPRHGAGLSRPSCVDTTGLADLSPKRRQAHHLNCEPRDWLRDPPADSRGATMTGTLARATACLADTHRSLCPQLPSWMSANCNGHTAV